MRLTLHLIYVFAFFYMNLSTYKVVRIRLPIVVLLQACTRLHIPNGRQESDRSSPNGADQVKREDPFAPEYLRRQVFYSVGDLCYYLHNNWAAFDAHSDKSRRRVQFGPYVTNRWDHRNTNRGHILYARVGLPKIVEARHSIYQHLLAFNIALKQTKESVLTTTF